MAEIIGETVRQEPAKEAAPGPSDPRGVRAQPPETIAALDRRPPPSVAGGIPAIVASARHVFREAGLLRGTRLLRALNQFDGYDCPGCAWPEPDRERSVAEFCENGAKAIAEEGTLRRVGPEFFARHGVAELGERSDYWLGKQGRLTHPVVLRPGATHYEPISWDEAFSLIARHLAALASPDEAVFYTSGRTSNEAAFLYQLFARELGTNNLPDCSNMCHESSGSALSETIGIGKGTVTLDDFRRARLVVVAGQNPGTTHPRMLSALQEAKRSGSSWRPTGSSSAGRWDSPSMRTRSTTSARSSTSCCCAARSASPAPACARSAATATCRATARWASTRSRTRPSSTRSIAPPGSPRLATKAWTRSRPSTRCTRVAPRCSSPWAATSSPRPPDTEYTADALRRAQLTAHVSTKLNRAHLIAGTTALILPCLGRTERDLQAGGEQSATTENSMGVVQMSRGRLPPAGEHLLSEPQIVSRLARATLGARSTVHWE